MVYITTPTTPLGKKTNNKDNPGGPSQPLPGEECVGDILQWEAVFSGHCHGPVCVHSPLGFGQSFLNQS